MGAKELGELLRDERHQLPHSKTQADIADDIGIKDSTTLSYWENGKRLKHHMHLIKLCARYDLSIDDLMEAINE